MFIIIVGTELSGKTTLSGLLQHHYGFSNVGIEDGSSSSLEELLDHTTHHWEQNFVTTSLKTEQNLLPFLKRPFVLVVAVDGPLLVRWKRSVKATSNGKSEDLEAFVARHDRFMNTTRSTLLDNRQDHAQEIPTTTPSISGRALLSHAHLTIINDFPTIDDLARHVEQINLLDQERLRPGWDAYFMTLASLASLRSNCMKRRVGAIVVRNKRILSTGYNGTPRGLTNCNQGGCARCNGTSKGGESLAACLCLHAEENALLEAGRERIGDDCVIYCNTCPCLTCSVKIVQCGVREVVYNLSYAVDKESAKIFAEGGVKLRKLEVRREIM